MSSCKLSKKLACCACSGKPVKRATCWRLLPSLPLTEGPPKEEALFELIGRVPTAHLRARLESQLLGERFRFSAERLAVPRRSEHSNKAQR